MLARTLMATLVFSLVGCDRPATKPVSKESSQEHAFAVYGVNGQSFLVDGKTGDVWVYGDTKEGKGFASVPVLGLRGVMQEVQPENRQAGA